MKDKTELVYIDFSDFVKLSGKKENTVKKNHTKIPGVEKVVKGLVCVAGVTFAGMYLVARKKKSDYTYKDEPAEQNPFAGKKVVFVQDDNDEENADGVRGHLEAVSVSVQQQSLYSKYGKRMLDVVLSFGGLVALSPVYAAIALAIKIEDPGPVLFTQKRVGQNKEYFKLHKFRSMKMCTPHDVPTHMLDKNINENLAA